MPNILASGDWWDLYDNGDLYAHCAGPIPSDAYSTGLCDIAYQYDDEGAFSQMRVIVAASVTVIPEYCFSAMPPLSQIIIQSGVTEIQSSAFYHTAIHKVYIPSSVRKIESWALPHIGGGVYYEGTEAQWNAIDIDEEDGDEGEGLLDVPRYYNQAIPADPYAPEPDIREIPVSGLRNPLAAVAQSLNLVIRAVNAEITMEDLPAALRKTLTTVHQDISGKVDKESGKGLSTNDFTNAYKTKLDSALTNLSAAVSGNGNAVTEVSYNNATGAFAFTKGTTFLTEHQSLASYALKSELPAVPTKVSDLTNDSGFLTARDIAGLQDSASQQAIDAAQNARLTSLEAQNAALIDYLKSVETYRTASGNPATFSDAKAANVKALSVTITPTQSGSGEPYPPGGGRNLLPILDTQNGIDSTFGLTWTIINGVFRMSGKPLLSGWLTIATFPENLTVTQDCVITTGVTQPVIYDFQLTGVAGSNNFRMPTGSSSATVPAGSYNKVALYLSEAHTYDIELWPMIRRASDTDPTFTPYSNIRPISGVSSVTVRRTGKNLIPATAWNRVIKSTQSYTVTALPDGALNINGTVASASIGVDNLFNLSTTFDNVKWIPEGNYIGYAEYSGSGQVRLQVLGYDEPGDVNFISGGTPVNTPNSFEVTDSYKYTYARLYIGAGTYNNLKVYPRIYPAEFSPTPFEIYKGESFTTSLVDSSSNPLTVYGGTLDITTGELTVTWKGITLDGSQSVNLYTTWDDSSCVYSVHLSTPPMAAEPSAVGGIGLSDQYPWYPYDTSYGGKPSFYSIRNNDNVPFAFCIIPAYSRLLIKNTRFNKDAAGLKTYLSEHQPTVAYPIATPLTYQLTPAQLATLAGYNAVSADAGPVSVTYRADTALIF